MWRTSLNGISGDGPAEFQTSVTGNTDLLTEILLRLPPKSLLRFQTVCKDWFSIISSQRFRLLHCRRKHSSGKVDGLFFCWWVYGNNHVDFIPINGMPKKQMGMIPLAFKNIAKYTPSKIESLHSCNGLFCISFNLGVENQVYYVYNPSTNQHRSIQHPAGTELRQVIVMNLAFDPMVSDSYRLVCVIKSNGVYEFSVYSSETRIWRDSNEILDIKQEYFLAQGVFLNGCMHWVSENGSFLRFDLDSLCFKTMPSTVIPNGLLKRNIRYFGQSGGHLHLIEVQGFSSMSFEVLELESDYSRWFVKYRVDLTVLHTAYPLMLSEELDLVDVNRRTCNVVCVVVDDKEQTTRFLVSTPDVIIEYDSRCMIIKEVAAVEKGKIPVMWEDVSVFEWYDAHRYVETMACV
ncbi:PREDICTED: F-box protein At5g07610-like [Nicotiana attenuata]|uniref:F-box protein n=1 Tax=Nicotiana attenuata TaxID=49451 RepID=A0A314LFC9_NICAT|nr:PREDICTED: F-box protein At5g07610-like [Nicotiana attenuata]OIT39837.1 f-box protein [Nicotiana attenuata]